MKGKRHSPEQVIRKLRSEEQIRPVIAAGDYNVDWDLDACDEKHRE